LVARITPILHASWGLLRLPNGGVPAAGERFTEGLKRLTDERALQPTGYGTSDTLRFWSTLGRLGLGDKDPRLLLPCHTLGDPLILRRFCLFVSH
jgi:hypothetical protein